MRIDFNGGYYDGELNANGEFHGMGEYAWANGDKFVGQWINGKRVGQGKYVWENGAIYEGDWSFDQRTGVGKYFWTNGDRYEGIFLKGVIFRTKS